LGGIFVSYRRSDSQGEAGRLFDDLAQHFGEGTIFMDVSAIEAGRDFRKAIEEGVAKCGVLLVVIGVGWLDAKDERGARRLDDPSDFVRIETASALKRDIPVIPVLVRGAKMPTAEQLPEELKELAYRNCMELTHARWRSDLQLLVDALHRLLGDTTPVATSATFNHATAPARSGPAQPDVTGSSRLEDGSSARIDPVAVQRITRELAVHIGPIAEIVVRRAASRCNSVEDLYLKVAEEIDSRDERDKFLLGRASIPATLLRNVKREATLESHPSGVAGSPSKGDDAKSETARPATGIPLSNRRKHMLLASVGGVSLILLLVLVTRFATRRGDAPSQPSQTSDQGIHIPDSAPVNARATSPPPELPAKSDKPTQSPSARETDETQPRSSQRVHVPEEVSRKLLISTVVPMYPTLARQARIQGTVVLDADISKDGTVETLQVISGHPLLVQAALDAVKQWRYKSYVLNGKPVAVNTQIIVAFTLGG